MLEPITRKCQTCSKYIDLEKESFIYDKKVYYHTECLFDHLTNKKRNSLDEQQAKEYISNLLPGSIEKGKFIVNRQKFYKWIQKQYELITLPTYFYQKSEEIFNGTWKDITRKIPPEDLWDMWYRKWDFLEKTYIYNKSHNKDMDQIGRLNYDFAIIINKSSSYYEWRKSVEADNISRKQAMVEENNSQVSYKKLGMTKKSNNKNNIDIAETLEEI
jgi:hypothetical protein